MRYQKLLGSCKEIFLNSATIIPYIHLLEKSLRFYRIKNNNN